MARRKIGEVNNGRKTAKIYRDSEWNEFRVRLYVDHVLNPASDYHTDDESDAFDTARVMVGKIALLHHKGV